MQAFLIRHAHAVEAEVGAERPLGKRGREQVRRLARFFAKRRFQFAELWHSPLARSRETPELTKKQWNCLCASSKWKDWKEEMIERVSRTP